MLVLSALWWLLSQDTAQHSKPINQVSLKSSEIEQQAEHQTIKQKLKTRAIQANSSQQNTTPNESIAGDDWSYLAIYRRLEWADVCQRYYRFAVRAQKNAASDFVSSFIKNDHHGNTVTAIDPRVESGLTRYQSRCETLKSAVFAYSQVDETELTYSNTVLLELQKLLDTTPTKTKKEKHLKSHVVMVQVFNQAQEELQKSYRESVAAESEKAEFLQRQMMALSQEMMALAEWLDPQEALAAYEALITEINHIDDQWVESYKGKGEAYQNALSNVLGHWIEIQAHLVGSDPDVFKLIKMASEWTRDVTRMGISVSAYRSELDLYLNTPGEQMMEAFGITSFALFSEAANPAAILYLCGLGYDCGSDSALAMQLCIKHYQEMPAACEVSVQDFYFNHALSPNLLEDVLTLYQWMEENYGE